MSFLSNGFGWLLGNNESSATGTVTSIATAGLISGGIITVSGTITTSVSTNKLVGRGTSGTGVMEEITLGTNLTLSGTTLNASGGGGGVTSVTGTTPIASSGGATPDISISQATTSTNGYLSSIDWNTFNNKGSGTVTSVSALTLGTTGTDLSSTIATGTTTPVITLNVPTASASNRGALSSADWTTFNNKGSGTVTSVGGTLPISSSGGATPTISISQSSGATNGYLSSTDWTTFNNKGSGTVLSVTSAFGDPIIVNNIDPSNPIISSGILVQSVTATSLITSSGGVTPNVSTLMATNKLVGRGTSGTGVMEEITLGTNLSLTGTTLNASGGGVTSVTGTTPIASSGGATPDISISQATTSTNGYLSSTDWNTFNNKESALTFTSPLARATNTISIPVATTSVNGYLSSTDWTTFNNKGSGTVTSVSGTLNKIDSTGGTTPIIDISATYVGQTSITTLGTIGTGVWNGTTIAIANGGTGQITNTLGFDALSPTTTRGDTIVRGVTNNVRLALGTVGKILRSDGTDLVYTTATYPTTTAVSTLLYSSSANVISALATANNGVLVTSSTGVPSISTQLTYVTTTGFFANTLSINAAIQISAVNSSTGNSVFIQLLANNGTYNFALQQLGTGYTTNGLLVANQSRLVSSSISSMLINTTASSVPIIFAVGGFTASFEAHRSTSSGIEFRVLLKSLIYSSANLMAGQITLVGGTLAITITGLTTSHRGMVTLVTPNNVLATRSYQAVCTVNTITIRANTDTGLLNMADTSVLNYFIFLNN